ncbi:hypothetical protein [Bosea sp. BH3]|uniref:hypothetical protein n=1 Tax=Bosea sp. BH3 TaxID=2871701 RepID=UPI0021CB7D09|nr:hypothetical protein [Bosea sp. BH3]MCU4182540.1 hypothetical protein [Bosea sp. BH3]
MKAAKPSSLFAGICAGIIWGALIGAPGAQAQNSPHPPTRPSPDNEGLNQGGSIGQEGTGSLPQQIQPNQDSPVLGRGETPPSKQDPGHQHSGPAQSLEESNPPKAPTR